MCTTLRRLMDSNQRVSIMSSSFAKRLGLLGIPLVLTLWGPSSFADDFKMNCDVQGTVPVMVDKTFPPARVALVIQTLGNNIFIQIVGPSPYDMKVSTLATKVMSGTNLTNPKHLGVRAKNKETGQESELVIDQKNVTLTGYNDIEVQKQMVRLVLTGQCVLPK